MLKVVSLRRMVGEVLRTMKLLPWEGLVLVLEVYVEVVGEERIKLMRIGGIWLVMWRRLNGFEIGEWLGDVRRGASKRRGK